MPPLSALPVNSGQIAAITEDGEFITLYHATTAKRAASIRASGIDLTLGKPRADFGQGFYTTTNRVQVEQWASTFGKDATILEFRVPKAKLNNLKGRLFSGGDSTWTRFVRACRSGTAVMHNFDYVSGPMLMNPGGFKRGAAMKVSGQQTSFHTQKSVDLLARSLLP